jgi:hypothetical protein
MLLVGNLRLNILLDHPVTQLVIMNTYYHLIRKDVRLD